MAAPIVAIPFGPTLQVRGELTFPIEAEFRNRSSPNKGGQPETPLMLLEGRKETKPKRGSVERNSALVLPQ